MPAHGAFFVDYDHAARGLIQRLLPARRTLEDGAGGSAGRAVGLVSDRASRERATSAFRPGRDSRTAA